MRQRQLPTLTRFLYSRAMLVISVALCAGLFFQLVKVVTRSTTTDQDIALLEEENARLADDYQRLERLTTVLESDYFAEREARTKLGYKKTGEQAVIIVAQGSPDTSTIESKKNTLRPSAESQSDAVSEQNAQRWWRFFFAR